MQLQQIDGYQEYLLEAQQNNYTLGVCAKVIDKNENILLLKRSSTDFSPSIWEMPGGSVEDNEDLLQGLIREVVEETGLKVANVSRFVHYFDFVNIENTRHKRKFCFEVLTTGSIKLSPDHQEWKYFTKDEVQQLDATGDREIWRDHQLLIV